jgi:DNA-binding LacI/PurR family transcriptional regulator
MTTTHEKSARLADVARTAGVSQGTVSNVFNHPEMVREQVRDHVLAVAAAIGYRGADPKGRLLRAGKVNAIGVATAEPLSYFFDDPFARELMIGMSDACDAAGAGLSLVSAANDEALAWNIQSALVDGFVLLCVESGERLVQLTRERQLPFVALALGKPDPTISAVGVDDFAGARLAAQHLAELGHRRFAILSLDLADDHVGPVSIGAVEAAVYSTSRDRIRGYVAGLAECGIENGQMPIVETHNEPVSVIAGLEHVFAAGEPPTALLCMSDRVALLAIDWLWQRGLAVPVDVSVIGFDGIPEGERAEPPLTTIVQPIARIGRRAVELILGADGGVHRETLPLSLLVRGSTAPPRR